VSNRILTTYRFAGDDGAAKTGPARQAAV